MRLWQGLGPACIFLQVAEVRDQTLASAEQPLAESRGARCNNILFSLSDLHYRALRRKTRRDCIALEGSGWVAAKLHEPPSRVVRPQSLILWLPLLNRRRCNPSQVPLSLLLSSSSTPRLRAIFGPVASHDSATPARIGGFFCFCFVFSRQDRMDGPSSPTPATYSKANCRSLSQLLLVIAE